MDTNSASVLVVDDVAENRDLLVRRLKRLGIADVEQAVNGVDALAAIGRRNFDVVLLDIMMPELDGFGVLEKLKADGKITDLPVIVISALNEIEPIVRCVELGAEDFIFKPFNPTLLRARVLATLEKKLLRDRTREELRRKQRELNEARTLQLALVPPKFSEAVAGRQVTIDVALEPAKEVGGDLVDHFRLSDDKIVVALGDVSDKGAGAALVMARTHSLIRGLCRAAGCAGLVRRARPGFEHRQCRARRRQRYLHVRHVLPGRAGSCSEPSHLCSRRPRAAVPAPGRRHRSSAWGRPEGSPSA